MVWGMRNSFPEGSARRNWFVLNTETWPAWEGRGGTGAGRPKREGISSRGRKDFDNERGGGRSEGRPLVRAHHLRREPPLLPRGRDHVRRQPACWGVLLAYSRRATRDTQHLGSLGRGLVLSDSCRRVPYPRLDRVL